MIIKELDIVKISCDIPEINLKEGMIGTVVHIHERPRLAYMVEFTDKQGRTNALHSLLPKQIVKANVGQEEHEKYLERKDLPYNFNDEFCVDPYS